MAYLIGLWCMWKSGLTAVLGNVPLRAAWKARLDGCAAKRTLGCAADCAYADG